MLQSRGRRLCEKRRRMLECAIGRFMEYIIEHMFDFIKGDF
jgi:hypothetical protein